MSGGIEYDAGASASLAESEAGPDAGESSGVNDDEGVSAVGAVGAEAGDLDGAFDGDAGDDAFAGECDGVAAGVFAPAAGFGATEGDVLEDFEGAGAVAGGSGVGTAEATAMRRARTAMERYILRNGCRERERGEEREVGWGELIRMEMGMLYTVF